jgi:hypothetical protein
MTIAPVRPTYVVPSRPSPVLDRSELLPIAQGLAATAPLWADPDEPVTRTWRTIAATDAFEAFVIAWPAGGSIELHDHGGSAGAVVVAAGELVETTVVPGVGGSWAMTSRPLSTGDHRTFGPGHVHDIVNRGPGPALSVHVYSPVLASMTFFERRTGTGLVAVRTESFPREVVR